MARYNQWQNKGLRDVIQAMDEGELAMDRGAFFGSIMGTLNHLLWGDTLWISRFDGGLGPKIVPKDSAEMTANKEDWARLRFLADGRTREWARSVNTVDLDGDLHFYSAAMDADLQWPISICVIQMFNHQTHHRGQIHAMLTAAGKTPQPTDLPFMPES
jgi:uncharacterized damage-inducible protein DinB